VESAKLANGKPVMPLNCSWSTQMVAREAAGTVSVRL
jgi:hypothetical protein